VCTPSSTLVVPTPAGRLFDQLTAEKLAAAPHLVVACGRYEGIDQRVLDDAATRVPVLEVSIGDYVLAGGEAAALVVIEAVARLLPGVLGNPDSVGDDSFSGDLRHRVEAPAFTRPAVYRGRGVPGVLTGGDHAAVARYRHDQSLLRTAANRPDLVARWDDADRARLAELLRRRDQPGFQD
jgi:tRNA (guanine37-N1)-methyltransferase